MLAASGQNDVLRTYFVSRRDGVDYNLAYIGSDFTADRPGDFDQAYMQALFDYGYREVRDGRAWHKVQTDWEAWQKRDLSKDDIVRLVLDGTVVRVRLDKRATGLSVLVALGVASRRAEGAARP